MLLWSILIDFKQKLCALNENVYPTNISCAGYANHINSIPEIQFVCPAVAAGGEGGTGRQAREGESMRERERERLSERESALQPWVKYCPLI